MVFGTISCSNVISCIAIESCNQLQCRTESNGGEIEGFDPENDSGVSGSDVDGEGEVDMEAVY